MILSKTYLNYFTVAVTLAALPAFIVAQCPPAPDQRYYYNLANVGSKLYIFGGSMAVAEYDVWSLDLANNFNTSCPPWTQATNLITSASTNTSPYMFGVAFNPNNKESIYVQGGDVTTNSSMQQPVVYDATQNNYTQPTAPVGQPMSPRSQMTATVDTINNKVWIVGGRDPRPLESYSDGSNKNYAIRAYNTIYSYQFNNNVASISIDQISINSPYGTPVGRFGHSTTLVNNKLFSLGGYIAVNSSTEMIIDFASAFVFDISSNSAISMETIGDIPSARSGFSAVASQDGHSIIVFGGIIADALASVTNEVAVLDTCTLTWSKQYINGHSNGRAAHQAYMYGKYMVTMLGVNGHDGQTPLPSSDVAILDTDTWTWVTSIPGDYSPSSVSTSPSCTYSFPPLPATHQLSGDAPKLYDTSVISNPNAHHDALTTPEKGGIGVAVPLFVIACLVGGFFFYRRRNKARQLNPRWMPGALSSNTMTTSPGAPPPRNDYPLFTYNNNTTQEGSAGNQGGLKTYTATDHDQWERQLIQDNERSLASDDKPMARHEDIWSRMRGLHAPGDEEQRH
ncbi:hypothetical protein BC941DRAFT_421186 [Chlamydoabsidia padenii]|nr:hypothetical protein BC941DRAFT_421186 [Chlamydoabsidia padenii]